MDVARPVVALAVCGDTNETLVSSVLAATGLRVELTSDFQEARERVVSGTPLLVVTDLRLGSYNGLHLAAVASSATPRIPVIVLAEQSDIGLREQAERFGATFAVTPLSAQALSSLVDEGLSAVRGGTSADRRRGERRQHPIPWAADREPRRGSDRRSR